MTSPVPVIPDEATFAAAQALLDEGGGPGNSIHSWRCEHPDRYGPCDCVQEVADSILAAALPYLTKTHYDDPVRAFLGEVGIIHGEHEGWFSECADIRCRAACLLNGLHSAAAMPAPVAAVPASDEASGSRRWPTLTDDGVLFMQSGEAVAWDTQWVVFAGGADPDNCSFWEATSDGQAEAEERAQWLTSGGHAYRKVDYGPWIVMPAALASGVSGG